MRMQVVYISTTDFSLLFFFFFLILFWHESWFGIYSQPINRSAIKNKPISVFTCCSHRVKRKALHNKISIDESLLRSTYSITYCLCFFNILKWHFCFQLVRSRRRNICEVARALNCDREDYHQWRQKIDAESCYY